MKKILPLTIAIFLCAQIAWAGRARINTVSAEPYASALVINADTGQTLFADQADKTVYPASVLKLMVLLTILDLSDVGVVHLDDMVQITDEAYKMGGSQVYLDPSEQFTVDDLLYALMVQSANDAAVALATHVAGSKEAFVDLMNQKARDLGMKHTQFYSVHGLPPATGQRVDVTTARDFAKLCRELAKRPKVFQYTSARVKNFRDGKFIMRNHNHLLGKLTGCDGFKTGYFEAAGFSIAATAKRKGVRLIALVMGSKDRKVRDAKAIELLNKGFIQTPVKATPEKTVQAPVSHVKPAEITPKKASTTAAGPPAHVEKKRQPVQEEKSCLKSFLLGILTGLAFFAAASLFIIKKRTKRNTRRTRL